MDVHIVHVHARKPGAGDAAVHEGVRGHSVGLQVSPQRGRGEVFFGIKAGFGEVTYVAAEGNRAVQNHIGDHAILLEPDLVADDAVGCRADSRPQGGGRRTGGAGGD